MFPPLPFLLQAVSPPAPPWWLEAIRSPAAVILALTLCTKLVIAPAIATYIRHELQNELKQIAEFPLLVDRVERIEKSSEVLAGMSVQLGRIEERQKRLSDEAANA